MKDIFEIIAHAAVDIVGELLRKKLDNFSESQ